MRETSGILLALVLLAAACSSPPPYRADAEEAFERGEYERAAALYEESLKRNPGDPLTREKAELARRRAFDERLVRARRAEMEYDLDAALAEVRAAGELFPGDQIIAEEVERLEDRRREIDRAVARARDLVAAGKDAEAVDLLRPLAGFRATVPELGEVLDRAVSKNEEEERARRDAERKAAVEKALADAASANARGAPGEAIGVLRRARQALGHAPELAEKEAALRKELALGLRRRAEREHLAGHPATALLLLRTGREVSPDGFSDWDEIIAGVEEVVKEQVGFRIEVREFEDGTRGRMDPASFRKALLAAAAASPSAPWIELAAAPRAPRLVAGGEVSLLEVAKDPPEEKPEVHEYVIRVEKEPNPARPELEAKVAELKTLLEDAEDQHEARERELQALKQLERDARVNAKGSRRYGPYSQANYFRLLGNAQRREAAARHYVGKLETELSRTESRRDAAPLYLEKKTLGRLPYVAVIRAKRGLARASVRLERPGAGGALAGSTRLFAERRVTDRVVEGNAQAGLPADPDELPDDAAVAALALEELAARTAAWITEQAVELRRELLDRARELTRAGDEGGALDRYVAFVLSSGTAMPLERANAEARIAERLGIRYGEGGDLDIERIRLE